jgi:hypothetical protein
MSQYGAIQPNHQQAAPILGNYPFKFQGQSHEISVPFILFNFIWYKKAQNGTRAGLFFIFDIFMFKFCKMLSSTELLWIGYRSEDFSHKLILLILISISNTIP